MHYCTLKQWNFCIFHIQVLMFISVMLKFSTVIVYILTQFYHNLFSWSPIFPSLSNKAKSSAIKCSTARSSADRVSLHTVNQNFFLLFQQTVLMRVVKNYAKNLTIGNCMFRVLEVLHFHYKIHTQNLNVVEWDRVEM